MLKVALGVSCPSSTPDGVLCMMHLSWCPGKDRVELLLALGASRLEATRALLQHSVATALTPVLNQMAVIGLVSIPGMMTGQILGGSSPAQVSSPCLVMMCSDA